MSYIDKKIIGEIKDIISFFDLVEIRANKRTVCPLHEGADNPSSFQVSEDGQFASCWSGACNFSGDIVDFIMHKDKTHFKGAVKYLAEKAGLKIDDSVTGFERKPDATLLLILRQSVEFWHQELMNNKKALEYLRSRGLTDEIIEKEKIGYAPARGKLSRLLITHMGHDYDSVTSAGIFQEKRQVEQYEYRYVFPFWRGSNVVYTIARLDETKQPVSDHYPKYLKHKKVEGLTHILYGEWHLKYKPEHIIITEGVFDYWAAMQLGYPSIALTSGSMSAEQFNVILPKLKAVKKVYLCLDTDLINKAGQQAAWKLAKKLRRYGVVTKIINLEPPVNCEGSYDLADLFVEKHHFNIESARTYDQIQCGQVKTLEDLENFLREIQSCSKTTDIEMIKVMVKENAGISSSQFNTIYKSIISRSEHEIANLILEQSEIAYNAAFGFVEYNNGCWDMITNETVDRRISDILDNTATGRGLNSVRTLLAARCELPSNNNMSPFNVELYRKRYIPFKNGCLDIKTWRLEDHKKEAYFTFQLPLHYDLQAECPRWTQFIEEVTAVDEEQAMLLQEVFGYTFLTDNRFQKFFVMFGEGANGKTRYLEILQKIMGNSASAVPLSMMDQQFALADLYDKNVNISSEDRSDIANSATIIKAISSGDVIRADRKFKKSFSFVPHCKIIVAMNEYPRVSDLSWGFFRRIEIVNWPVKFVGTGDHEEKVEAPLIMPKDMNLDKTLETELPGIVNWSIIGLKRLLKNGKFTASEEHLERQLDFKRSVDVIQTFFDMMLDTHEFKSGESYTKDSIYGKYRIWSEENGHKAFASPQFFKRAYSNNILSQKREYESVNGKRIPMSQVLKGIKRPKVKVDFDAEMEKEIKF